MNDHTINDPLKALEAELSVSPSPEFTAKVRMRVAEAAPRRSPFVWWTLAGSAVAAGVVALALSTPRPAPAPPVASHEPARDVTAPVVQPPRVEAMRRADPPRPSVTRVAIAEPVAVQYGNVLVPGDQALALDALLAGVRTGRSVVPARPDPLVELPAWTDIKISPVQIEPLPDLIDTEGDDE